MTTANEILSCAAGEIGVVERYNNNVKYNTEYYGREVSGSEYPWCCCFIWWLFKHSNASELLYDGKKTALCQTLANWFRQKGYWHTVNPQPGDIVFFKFGSSSRYTDHVGIVEKINNDGSIGTIEGNTSTANQNNGGMVMRRTRKAYIVGYGRPQYDLTSSVKQQSIITKVNTSGSRLNVRESASNGKVVDRLVNGSIVDVLDVENNWYKIGDNRYVMGSYIKSNTNGIVTANLLNIRDKDSAVGAAIGVYTKDTNVEILRQSGTGWYLTPKGWVSNNYVKLV